MNRDELEAWLTRVGPVDAFTGLASLVPAAAVFAVDAARDVVVWNDAAARLLGFSADEVVGRHCLTGIRCEACLAGCGVAERGEVQGVPLVLHRKDGAPVAVRKWGRALRGVDGEFLGTLEVLVPERHVEGVDAHAHATGSLVDRASSDVLRWHGIVTRDPGMRRALMTIKNVAETEATVLVRGESGTGKELVARALHAESLRREGPFVAVNCAALTPSLLESELFGHVRGAFTGATHDRQGLFERARGGTLLLDEVGELPLALQSKLLRVLQEREVVPVGGNRAVAIDVRVVAATHRALREEVRLGRFREDLMYRLRVVPIFLPALRERPADVPLLVEELVEQANTRGPRRVTAVSPDALRALASHAWPGNVRELQNAITYAFAVARSPVLGLEDLPPEIGRGEGRHPPLAARDEHVERRELVEALERSGGDLVRAAQLLGVSRTTLWRRRKRYGV